MPRAKDNRLSGDNAGPQDAPQISKHARAQIRKRTGAGRSVSSGCTVIKASTVGNECGCKVVPSKVRDPPRPLYAIADDQLTSKRPLAPHCFACSTVWVAPNTKITVLLAPRSR